MLTTNTHRVEWVDTELDPELAEDEPMPTPESAMGWLATAQGALLLLATFCAGMAAHHFFF